MGLLREIPRPFSRIGPVSDKLVSQDLAEDDILQPQLAEEWQMPKPDLLRRFLDSLPILAIAASVALLLHYLKHPTLERPAAVAVIVMAVAFKIYWYLHRRWWFWLAMVVIGVLHVPIILLVPWPAGWIPAPIIIPFGTFDLIVVFALISLLEKLDDERRTGVERL